jgi:DNA repair photolyase
MAIREIQAKTILRKRKKIDSWFISHYAMNLYRGCLHNCAYCDGRAERYYVEGEFGRDIVVKTNAIEILERELDPRRRRKPLKRSYMLLGGGVGDSYGPVEEKYGLTRRALELIDRFGWPVHILTKSTLVERDIDLLRRFRAHSRAMVSFSFSSMEAEICARFEPLAAPPQERLDSMARIRSQGVSVGMFLMPVIPLISDFPEMIDSAIKMGKRAGAQFVIFSPMTLKTGRQKDHFLHVLKRHFPDLLIEYEVLYPDSDWGHPSRQYSRLVFDLFHRSAAKHRIPVRIPNALFGDLLSENDRAVVILEQIDYVLKCLGRSSPYGYAANSISRLDRPLGEYESRLRTLKGVGKTTERLLREIIHSGRSGYHEKLIGVHP